MNMLPISSLFTLEYRFIRFRSDQIANWLRCTLLIGNILVNSTFSILLFVKMDTALASTQTLSVIMVIAICASTLIIAIFGGIIPQAIFSRYALFICAVCIWIVWPLMYILGIVSYPIAHLLDKILGDELGSVYRYSLKELEKLVDIHAEIEGMYTNNICARIIS